MDWARAGTLPPPAKRNPAPEDGNDKTELDELDLDEHPTGIHMQWKQNLFTVLTGGAKKRKEPDQSDSESENEAETAVTSSPKRRKLGASARGELPIYQNVDKLQTNDAIGATLADLPKYAIPRIDGIAMTQLPDGSQLPAKFLTTRAGPDTPAVETLLNHAKAEDGDSDPALGRFTKNWFNLERMRHELLLQNNVYDFVCILLAGKLHVPQKELLLDNEAMKRAMQNFETAHNDALRRVRQISANTKILQQSLQTVKDRLSKLNDSFTVIATQTLPPMYDLPGVELVELDKALAELVTTSSNNVYANFAIQIMSDYKTWSLGNKQPTTPEEAYNLLHVTTVTEVSDQWPQLDANLQKLEKFKVDERTRDATELLRRKLMPIQALGDQLLNARVFDQLTEQFAAVAALESANRQSNPAKQKNKKESDSVLQPPPPAAPNVKYTGFLQNLDRFSKAFAGQLSPDDAGHTKFDPFLPLRTDIGSLKQLSTPALRVFKDVYENVDSTVQIARSFSTTANVQFNNMLAYFVQFATGKKREVAAAMQQITASTVPNISIFTLAINCSKAFEVFVNDKTLWSELRDNLSSDVLRELGLWRRAFDNVRVAIQRKMHQLLDLRFAVIYIYVAYMFSRAFILTIFQHMHKLETELYAQKLREYDEYMKSGSSIDEIIALAQTDKGRAEMLRRLQEQQDPANSGYFIIGPVVMAAMREEEALVRQQVHLNRDWQFFDMTSVVLGNPAKPYEVIRRSLFRNLFAEMVYCNIMEGRKLSGIILTTTESARNLSDRRYSALGQLVNFKPAPKDLAKICPPLDRGIETQSMFI